MPTLSLRLPDSLQRQLRELAKREGISINQVLASAMAEKLAALKTDEHSSERAHRGRGTNFKAGLEYVARRAGCRGAIRR